MSVTASSQHPDVVIDRTHIGRRASGIERITDDLFCDSALSPLTVGSLDSSGGRLSMIAKQSVANPLHALRHPQSIYIFPGYPPSPAFGFMHPRAVMYVHDVFLLTRKKDLNLAARLYMAPAFRRAVRHLRYFFVNSETTRQQLSHYVGKSRKIQLYRPHVRNVFDVSPRRLQAANASSPLVVGALGTVEPRKNFLLAAAACERLSQIGGQAVELHIVGRAGWGDHFAALKEMPHVRLHGYLSDDEARRVIERFDLFLCTSHDEGLGLPLLEMQHAGLPVVAPDKDVFREALGLSGRFFVPDSAESAADQMATVMGRHDWRAAEAGAALQNVARWNESADRDRSDVIEFLTRLRESLRGATAPDDGAFASPNQH